MTSETAPAILRDGFVLPNQPLRRSSVRSWKNRPIGDGVIQYCGSCGMKVKVWPGKDQFNCPHCRVLAVWTGPFFSTPFIKT